MRKIRMFVVLGMVVAMGLFVGMSVDAQSAETKLTASDGAAGDHFGYSVSISGGTCVIGARYDDDKGDGAGSAYVFSRSGTTWSEQAKLTASDGAAGDVFGTSVSISGNTIIVGAPYDDDEGPNTGSAYVYEYDGSNWNFSQKLTRHTLYDHGYFGYAVSVSGNRAFIGEPMETHGWITYWRKDGGSWIPLQISAAAGSVSGDEYGYAVSIDGNYVIVGAPNHAGAGAAYIREFDEGSWGPNIKITAPDGVAGDKFGHSVSICGNMAVVGADRHGASGSRKGAAYVYERTGGTWTFVQKLTASDGAADDYFGGSVSISGGTCVIGASFDDDLGNVSGSAYVFVHSGGTWSQQAKLTASDGAADAFFGCSVSISPDTWLVGACGQDAPHDYQGAAYVFLPPPNTPQGSNVKVTPEDCPGGAVGGTPVTVEFPQVDEEGQTSLCTFKPDSGDPDPPANFRLGKPHVYYNVTTTAHYSLAGKKIKVCITYDPAHFDVTEDDIKIRHYENGKWEKCECSQDLDKNEICCCVDHLSYFVLGYLSQGQSVGGTVVPPNKVELLVHWIVQTARALYPF